MISKIQIQLFSVALFVGLLGATAEAAGKTQASDVCARAEAALTRLQANPSEKTIADANQLLSDYQTPDDVATRLKDLRCLVPLSVTLITQDKDGLADEYTYDIYDDAPREFTEALSVLPAAARTVIQQSIAQQKSLWHQ